MKHLMIIITYYVNISFLTAASWMSSQDIIDLFAGRSSFADSINSDTEFSGRGSNKSSEHNPSCLAHSSASVSDPFQPFFATSFPSDIEFSARDTPDKSKNPIHQHSIAADFDPFAAIAVRNLDGSDSDVFSSNTGSGLNEPRHDPPVSIKSSDHSPLEELNFGAFTSHTELPKATAIKSLNKSPTKPEPASMSASKTDVKKGAFQVKSGIWADSLSRGLIDLNITARMYFYNPFSFICMYLAGPLHLCFHRNFISFMHVSCMSYSSCSVHTKIANYIS